MFVEGILVLECEALRQLMDIRLYVDVDADERVLRRLSRDIRERGRTVESVVQQYLTVVRPCTCNSSGPSKRYAHLIIPEGGHNKVAIDLIATKIRNIIRSDRLRASTRPDDRRARRRPLTFDDQEYLLRYPLIERVLIPARRSQRRVRAAGQRDQPGLPGLAARSSSASSRAPTRSWPT